MELDPLPEISKHNDLRIVENTASWINAILVNSRMFYTISQWELTIGTTIDFKKSCKIEFGAYAEAHKNTFPRNSMQSRTEPHIYIGSTGNIQGYY